MKKRKKLNFFLLQLLIILLLSFQTTVANAQGENPANAIPISLGGTVGDMLGPAADGSIWYVIHLSAGDYEFSLTGPGGTDFDLDLFDSNEVYITGAYDEVYPDKFFVLDLEAGDFYINVYANSGTGAFTLNIAEYTRVDGDYYDNPIRINLDDTIGNMPGPGASGEIYYVIYLSAGDYEFSLTGPGGTDFNMYLFDDNGNNIGIADDTTYPDILMVTGLGVGYYLVTIFPITGTGEFTLNIATYSPPTGDSPANAIPIAAISKTVGVIPGPGASEEIWYIITLPAGGRRFSLTGPSETDFNLDLYDSNEDFINSADDTYYPDELIILDLETGDFFIAIRPITGIGAFTLTITEYTPGKSSDSAIVIGLDDTVDSLPGPGLYGEIWFSIPLDAGDYQISLTGPGGTDFNLDFFNSTFSWIGGAYSDDYPDKLIVTDLESGDYYIAVIASNGTGDFTLTIAIYAPTLDEPPINAITIELGDTTGSLLGLALNGSIWYNITLLSGNYQYSLTGPEGTNFNLELYDSSITYIAGTYDFSYPDVLTILDLETGIYYINVFNASIDIGTGAFTLTISEYIPPTTLTTTDTSTTTLTTTDASTTTLTTTDASTTTTSSTASIFFFIPFTGLVLNTFNRKYKSRRKKR